MRCRLPIEWTVIHQGGVSEDAKIPFYEKNDWGAEFDVAVHNECFPKTTDPTWVEKIAGPHRRGLPAVLVHCALQSYPDKDGLWSSLCGIEFGRPLRDRYLRIKFADQPHSSGIVGKDFELRREDILPITKVTDPKGVVAWAHLSNSSATRHPCFWTHQFGERKTKIFATSLGDRNENMIRSEFLDTLTRGFLWSIERDLGRWFVSPEQSLLRLGKNLLTEKGAATQSSFGEAELAADGDPTTVWRHPGHSILNWWEARLAGPVLAEAVAVYWETPRPSPFIIEGSPNGKVWKEIARSTPNGTAAGAVSFHPIAAQLDRIRISNPESGVLRGIREVAVYRSRREVPFHLLSAARPQSSRPKRKLPPLNDSLIAGTFEPNGISPTDAFRLLDDLSAREKWSGALDRLSTASNPAATKELMNRIESVDSGRARKAAIRALARSYRTPSGEPWEKSGELARFLESLFSDKRVDKFTLLAALTRNDIPVRNIYRIIQVTENDSSLKELRIKLLQQNRITYRALDFLTEVTASESEDPELRCQAAALLAKSPDMLAMRDAFKLGASKLSVDAAVKNQLFDSIIGNPTWEAQADWLAKQTTSESARERELAWQILLYLLADDEVRPSVKDFVNQLIAEAETVGGKSLLSLLAQLDDSSHYPRLRGLAQRLTSREDSEVVEAANRALTAKTSPDPVAGDFPIKETIRRVIRIPDPDPVNGEVLFRTHCALCHSRGGPDLRQLKRRYRKRTVLLDSIFQPDERISPQFPTVTLETTNGTRYSGFVSRETSREIDLTDQAGNRVTLEIGQIKNRRKLTRSTMPAGAVRDLPIRDLADLVEFLVQYDSGD